MLEEDAAYSLKLIREACHNALQTIDSGAAALHRRRVRLRQTPLDIPVQLALAEQQLLLQNIHLSLLLPSTIPKILLDEVQIRDVLCNLFANAADAIAASEHPQRGELVVRIHRHAKWVLITVEDNGCGMGELITGQIFEPFYSTKSSSTNWGMGLPLCQKIMAAHHGSIAVESVPGVGTRFDLIFPGG